MGTGTSCLLITLVLEFKKKVKGVGVDNSVEALKVAKKNIEKLRKKIKKIIQIILKLKKII